MQRRHFQRRLGVDGRGVLAGMIENLQLKPGTSQLPTARDAIIDQRLLRFAGSRVKSRSLCEVTDAKLDIIMLFSLLIPGDERNQVIVWKASSFTLLGTVGANVLEVIINFVRAQPMTVNPFIQLETAAIIYFAALLYYKKKHGG